MGRVHTVGTGGAATDAPGRFWRHVSAPFRSFRDLRSRIRLENTLSSLGDHQLVDLGLSRGEIPAYARGVAQAEQRLSRMLQRQEVAPEFVMHGSGTRGALLKVCRTCPNILACDRWFRTHKPAGEYRAFCPNAEELDALPHRPESRPAPQARR